jgi:transposase
MPAKADPVVQAEFLATQLRPRLDQAERGKRAVLFVDAAHFVFGPYLGHLWCLVRMYVKGMSGRQRYNVLGALDAVTHRVITVANDSYINAHSVCELLRRVANAGLPGPITLVMDNARYQRCELVQSLARQMRIELLFLPPYSPNLNLIERVWKFVKKEALASKNFDTYEAFGEAIEDCLGKLSTRYKAEMDTLLTLNFQLFEDVPLLSA